MLRKALGLTAALVAASLITVAVAQSRRVPPPALEQVNRALLEGRYDDVPRLAATLDAQDPAIAALLARAAMARGRYEETLVTLRPIAQRAPTSDAALEYGLLMSMLGRAEAVPVLERVARLAETADDPIGLARAARALRALNRPYEANAAYRAATAMMPRDVAINTAYGDLFLERFQYGDAAKSYQDVLDLDGKYPPALLGMAKAMAHEDPPQAVKLAEQVLEINPANVSAHLFLAEEEADAGRRDDARKLLEKALAVNPSSLEARSLLAAFAYVEDKPAEFEAEVARVLAIAPGYGEVYRVAAETASHNFRYDDATLLAQKAVALDAGNGRILSDLGTHLLRTGDEPGARNVLERSFKLDGFNPITKNLLDMMDTLDTFVTVKDADIIIRMHKDEAPALTDYAVSLAHQALDTVSKRYQFTPKGPILIEIFPKHDDFAVRTAGLPGLIGALGVCFGRVVTLDSPRARPGEFQWEATLWHELTHVVTLQMSNYRVPRWLTEGISVYEETLQRPEWGRGMEMQFASMLNEDATPKLRDLNSAFTNPRTISVAYFQASLLVAHIVATYGDAGLHRLLHAYGQGLNTDAALKAALNTDFDQMQVGFDQTLDRMFGKLRVALKLPDEGTDLTKMPVDALKVYASQHQDNYPAQMILGTALKKEGDLDQAVAAFERAAAAAPMATGADSPYPQLAEIALQKKDTARAIAALRSAMDADFDNVALARRLAALMKENGVSDMARLRPVYQRIAAIDPFDADAHAVLGRLAMQANQPDAAIREFKAVVALKPVDQAAAFTDLAESYYRSGRRTEARRQTLAALEIAPSYERAQNLLLELAESRP